MTFQHPAGEGGPLVGRDLPRRAPEAAPELVRAEGAEDLQEREDEPSRGSRVHFYCTFTAFSLTLHCICTAFSLHFTRFLCDFALSSLGLKASLRKWMAKAPGLPACLSLSRFVRTPSLRLPTINLSNFGMPDFNPPRQTRIPAPNPHTCAHMCTHVHTCAHMCTHVHTCAHMCTHVHTCAHMCTHVHASTDSHF